MKKEPGRKRKWINGFLDDMWECITQTGELLAIAIATIFGGG